MSTISRCKQHSSIPRPLPFASMIRLLMMLGVALVLCLAHLHIRFCLSDLRRETNQLQTLEGTLDSEINALSAEVESLKHPDTLNDFARNKLGMVPYNPVHREVIRIPEQIHIRYAMARAQRKGREDRTARTDALWVEALGERLGLSGRAMASEAP